MADIKVGVSIPTVIGNPIDMATVAKRAEELGFESIWAPEHTLVPVNVETRFPYSEDGAVPPYYSHMMDPFVALSHASASTSTIKLGTGVTLLPERNPILLAKVIASLDHFSGGRTVVGIGAGWLREELDIMGGNFRRRWSQARESVLAMKELWTKDVSEFHGEFYDFPPVRSFPQARAEAPSAHSSGRHGQEGAEPGGGVRRRLGAQHRQLPRHHRSRP